MHVSRSTKVWFIDHGIVLLGWPACSPDLNPMENIWSWQSRQLYKANRQYESVQELRNALIETWRQITPAFLENYVNSMKNRIFEVIHNGGYSKNIGNLY